MATAVLSCTEDAGIANNVPTTNQGGADSINSGESDASASVERALLKFGGLSDGTIPSSATIQSATLRLVTVLDRTSNTRTKRLYRVKMAWVENQVTWNIYSTGNNWQTAGCAGANDRESTEIGSLSINATPSGAYEWSLTPSAIQEIVNGTFSNNGFILVTDTENNDQIKFGSRENATSENRPLLTVVYTVGPPKAKTWNGVAIANVKTINGKPINEVKSVQGLT